MATVVKESSFNMTGRGEGRGGGENDDIEGAPKIFRHPKGSLKNCWAKWGAPKICII